jgi:hypothetical protein
MGGRQCYRPLLEREREREREREKERKREKERERERKREKERERVADTAGETSYWGETAESGGLIASRCFAAAATKTQIPSV